MIDGYPLVSVIISTYNSEKFIRGRIDNLLRQSIIDKIEIIVINSGSLQNEEEIIRKYQDQYPNIVYYRTENRETIYKAWNRGIKLAKGQFICNANTDDRLHPDALEILSNVLIKNRDVALVYADQYITDIPNLEFDETLLKRKCLFPDFDKIKQMQHCIIGSQPMWRASLHFNDNIWFDETYEVCGDQDFELRIAEKYRIIHISQLLGYFYKPNDKKNKELENPAITMSEVEKINKKYVDEFVKKQSLKELEKVLNIFKKFIIIPIPAYIFLKRLYRIIDKNIYPRKYFYTVEFMYFFVIKICTSLNRKAEAIKYCKRYLRFKKSEKISELYKDLS